MKFGIQKGAGASYFKGVVTPSLTTWIEIIALAAAVILISWRLDLLVNRDKHDRGMPHGHDVPRSGIFWRV